MKLTSLADWNVPPSAKTLDVVGEWWTLLILRDASGAPAASDDFQAGLGLARSCADCPLRNYRHGISNAAPITQHPPRYEYHLTEKGGPSSGHHGADGLGRPVGAHPGGPPVLLVPRHVREQTRC